MGGAQAPAREIPLLPSSPYSTRLTGGQSECLKAGLGGASFAARSSSRDEALLPRTDSGGEFDWGGTSVKQ